MSKAEYASLFTLNEALASDPDAIANVLFVLLINPDDPDDKFHAQLSPSVTELDEQTGLVSVRSLEEGLDEEQRQVWMPGDTKVKPIQRV